MLTAGLLACFSSLVARAHAAVARPVGCTGAHLHPTPTDAGAVQVATLCLVDEVRTAHHLKPLRANRELASVAASEVAGMVHRDYFADVSPSGQTPMSLVVLTHYPAHAADISVAQNIAWGTGADTTPARIVAAWMASPPHREIILDGEYRDAGAAVTAAVPSVLNASRRGATYAIELGVRRF